MYRERQDRQFYEASSSLNMMTWSVRNGTWEEREAAASANEFEDC